MKSSKTCVTTEGLKFCDIYGIDNYACGALNYFDKTCGAQRFIEILRSQRYLLLCLRSSQRFQQNLRNSKIY
jgi:hypothetical protein